MCPLRFIPCVSTEVHNMCARRARSGSTLPTSSSEAQAATGDLRYTAGFAKSWSILVTIWGYNPVRAGLYLLIADVTE